MALQAQQLPYLSDFDIRFGQPYPKLGFKFNSITKKWQTVEPYKIPNLDSRRTSQASQHSSQPPPGQSSSSKKPTPTNHNQVITTLEDQSKLKLIQEQRDLIEKQIELQATEKARVECQKEMIKVQLVGVMELMQKRLDQVSKLHINIDHDTSIVNGTEKSFDDSKIISPEKIQIKKSINNQSEEEEDQKIIDEEAAAASQAEDNQRI